jgi:hypothetical protein
VTRKLSRPVRFFVRRFIRQFFGRGMMAAPAISSPPVAAELAVHWQMVALVQEPANDCRQAPKCVPFVVLE